MSKRLQKATVEKIKRREHRRKPRSGRPSSETRYGVLPAVHHVLSGVWCCPEHGPLAQAMRRVRSVNSGTMEMGPVVAYSTKSLGRPVLLPWARICWSEYLCEIGNHIVRVHNEAGTMAPLYPDVIPHFYTPDPGSESYPLLDMLFPRRKS